MKTYLLITDETNKQPNKNVKFFVYGGLFIPVETIAEINQQVEHIRNKNGFQEGDQLKFDTNSRAKHISAEQHATAKSEILDLCIRMNFKFTTYVILHDIIKKKSEEDIITYGANTIFNSFNSFLTMYDAAGMCVIDRLSFKRHFIYLKEKFNEGLSFPDGSKKKLDRIHLYSYTSEGASHLYSLIDIVLGGFRYCINASENRPAVQEILPKIIQILWSEKSQDKTSFELHEYGLLLRPKDISYEKHEKKYSELIQKLVSFMS